MPVFYQINKDDGLVKVIAKGKLTDSEILNNSHQLFSDKNFDIGFDQLIDLRNVGSLSVTTKGIKQLIAHERQRMGGKCGGKKAIVATSDISFGTARVYQTLSFDKTFTIEVFRKHEKAIKWLGLPYREDLIERRKHKRFKVKEGAFVGFTKPCFLKLDKPLTFEHAALVDISRGGLAFKYVDCEMQSDDFNALTISKGENEIKIDKVPFEVISDFTLSKIPSSKSLRRCGVKFGNLTSSQKSSLYSFIHTHTISDYTMDRCFEVA